MLFKNVAGQKVPVYAHDTNADAPKTGDAANITARISKDGAAVAQTNDVTPAELSATLAKGVYLFDLTQGETDCDLLIPSAASSTADVHIEPVIIYTQGGAVPKAAPGAAGGLPTVDENNRLAGIQGTINTLDALDTAQDARHDATQTAVGDVPTNAEFEARTLPTADYATAAGQTAIAGYVDCLPETLDGATFTNLPPVALTVGERAALVAAIEGELADDATGDAIKQAVVDKLLENLPDLDDLTLAAIGNASRDAILDRLLSGNHDIAGTVGKLLQHLDAAISSRHASGAAVAKSPATVDWAADVSNKPTIGTSTHDAADVKAALEADGSKLDHLWEMTEDNEGTRRLTEASLTQAPSGTAPTVNEIWAGLNAAQLAKFAATDTGETSAAAGSVAKLAQGSAGGNVTVEAFTEDARAEIAAAASVTVTPLTSTVSAGQVSASDVTLYQNAAIGPLVWSIVDSDGDAVDLGGKSLALVAHNASNSTGLWSLTSAAGELSVGGDNNNQITADADDTHTGDAGVWAYTLWNLSDDRVLARGRLAIIPAGEPT